MSEDDVRIETYVGGSGAALVVLPSHGREKKLGFAAWCKMRQSLFAHHLLEHRPHWPYVGCKTVKKA